MALADALLALPLRDLPWRRTRDPWGVLVSEAMLQQTQAVRVAPRWPGFLRPVAIDDLPGACGWPDDLTRAATVAASLVDDGLARWDDDRRSLRLP